nr:PepSY domain-containing protein [uncultured Rhodopila sp.]
MRNIIALAAAIAAVLLATTDARAGSLGRPCTAAPQGQYLTAPQLQEKAEALGYKVSRVKIAKACGEIYAFDKDGTKVELFVDPTNGTIVGKN